MNESSVGENVVLEEETLLRGLQTVRWGSGSSMGTGPVYLAGTTISRGFAVTPGASSSSLSTSTTYTSLKGFSGSMALSILVSLVMLDV